MFSLAQKNLIGMDSSRQRIKSVVFGMLIAMAKSHSFCTLQVQQSKIKSMSNFDFLQTGYSIESSASLIILPIPAHSCKKIQVISTISQRDFSIFPRWSRHLFPPISHRKHRYFQLTPSFRLCRRNQHFLPLKRIFTQRLKNHNMFILSLL